MAKIEILLPAMGEGIVDATITKWLVKPGEKVEEDQSILEVATDKVDSEIPAPEDGIITELLFKEGEIPQVGQTLAILEIDGDTADSHETKENNENGTHSDVNEIGSEVEEISNIVVEKNTSSVVARTSNVKFLSPLVRNIIQHENISSAELESIRGTSNSGRITKDDIIKFLAHRSAVSDSKSILSTPSGKKSEVATPQNKETIYSGDNFEVIEMDRMRKLIADHMVNSKKISPHVTSFVEIDVTDLVNWRNSIKDDFLNKEKTKLTFTPLFIEATVKALKDLPMVNVSVDGDKIVVKKNINIGMATALPDGNLIVPVIKNADKLSIIGLANNVNDLASRARNNKLKPDEIQSGTFTITNFGTFGNLSGTPIINQPQVAILGVGAITKKPAVIETPSGDAIAIRHIMILSLSYDHRVVDGALGGMFLRRIGDYLENFDSNRKY